MGLFDKTKNKNDNPSSVLPNPVGAFNPGSRNTNSSGPFEQADPSTYNSSAYNSGQNIPQQQNYAPLNQVNQNVYSNQPSETYNQPLPNNMPTYQRPIQQAPVQNQNNQIPRPGMASNTRMVQNLPAQNQMPDKVYTNRNHMVPMNKISTPEESKSNKSSGGKNSVMKEILAGVIPFGLGDKIFKTNNSTTGQDDDFSIVDEGSISVQDFIAPSAIEVDFNEMRIGNKFIRTIFAIDYKFSNPGMLEQIVNYEEALDISMFYYPINSGEIVKKLRQKISEFEASLNLDLERGRVPDAYIKVSLQDAIRQQELLASGIEKWFNFALYITMKADSVKELNNMTQALLSILASKEISAKTSSLAMEKAFQSSIPVGVDKLFKVRNMDTTSIANTFPFTSSDLSMDKGIMYGINTYNRSLVIFDRFAMPNANMVVFATSGAGKSFMVKLEAIRSLMLGTEVIVIDPENEYQGLARSIGGAFISFSQDGSNKVNPFELSGIMDSNEDELKLKELSLIGFFKLAFGQMTNSEMAILERAIRQAYFEKGITNNPATHKLEAPRMEDLYKVFKAMIEPEALGLADRLEKFIIGSASGIFDKKTNVDLNNPFTVFSIRDLSDELKPLAMYFMMDFIWNKVKREPRKRILIVDEAWLLMRYPESALFINSIAKRARKYYLGLTVISQNVEDFLQSDIGVAVVTNSSIQVLLKQHPTAIDKLQKVFYLSDGEKSLLLGAGVGMGLFFADNNHVAIEIKASDQEYKLCSTRPQETHDKKEEFIESQQPTQRAIPNSLI
ncbi:MAG: DUF87 domain-containing protein [bacterium]